MIFDRSIEIKIKSLLFKNRAILIFGPRQSGKTTLAKKIIGEFKAEGEYFNCENLVVRNHFALGEPEKLKNLVGDKKIVVFDEAQTIQDIGSILKIFIDTYPQVQIITTGSSSFDLANKINEPLTGRSFEFTLYPLSLEELNGVKSIDACEFQNLLRLGMYPAIVAEKSVELRENLLKNITSNYLYKDIFIFESIKNPTIFENLLRLLALQIGSEVSVYELSKELGISRFVVEKYIRLLEQSYVIRRVYSFSNNFRNEIKKAFKVYFIDIGIRNVISESLNKGEVESIEEGHIFENFVFTELLKRGSRETFQPRIYFWRTKDKLEIDFIEVIGSNIHAYECKLQKQPVVFKSFLKRYPKAFVEVVTPQDYYNINSK